MGIDFHERRKRGMSQDVAERWEGRHNGSSDGAFSVCDECYRSEKWPADGLLPLTLTPQGDLTCPHCSKTWTFLDGKWASGA